ncbi:hypothetical protein GCM10027174_45800 [Salinifilum aidingensis]
MSRYLEEAAEQLRRAGHDLQYCPSSNRREQRQRLAEQFAELAAIDKGLLPERLARKDAGETDTEL